MDAYLEGETLEPEVDTTPNIEFQLNKFNDDENITKKQIPENALFAPIIFKDKLKKYRLLWSRAFEPSGK